MNQGEQGYLDMLSYIMENGVDKGDRTGTGTREVFGQMLRFDLSDGSFPIFTTKQVFWKTAFKEMLWMLSGSRNIRPLLEQNCHIWSEWPHARYKKETGHLISLEAFEAAILNDQEFADKWGDTGGAYGYQWRHWPVYQQGAPLYGDEYFTKVGEVDQIQEVIDTLKNNPDSRRIIFTAWNVPELGTMMLPPCHIKYQFQVSAGKLNMSCEIRSWDVFLGAPFNIANAAMLLRLMALHTGFEPGELVMFGNCVHVYSNHFDQVREQLSRKPGELPMLCIREAPTLFDQTIDDFVLVGYTHQGKIEGDVAV